MSATTALYNMHMTTCRDLPLLALYLQCSTSKRCMQLWHYSDLCMLKERKGATACLKVKVQRKCGINVRDIEHIEWLMTMDC